MSAPGIPQNLIVQAANQLILVSWDLSAGADSYQIQRSLDNATYTNLVTIGGNPLATSYLDNTVSIGTQYWYRVSARNASYTGDITSGSPIVTGILSTAGFVAGQIVVGLGIPDNTAILSVDSLTQITLTQNALSGASTPTLLSNSASSYTTPQSEVPAPTGEMCLSQIRLKAMQRADRVNSNFVTKSEWNSYINQAMFELYDILVTEYEDYFIAPIPCQFNVTGNQFLYPLPNGSITFQNGLDNSQPDFVAPPFYKLMGVDLALNNASNAYVTINKFNFINRNRFVYPNTASTIYGVFNLQYRVMGSNIEFIPTPTSGQKIRLWYIPRLAELLQDTDITTTGVSGWLEYVIVRAAYLALTKEESDTAPLVMQLQAVADRIVAAAANRDAGQPDTISDTRSGNGNGWGNGFGGGWNGGVAGW